MTTSPSDELQRLGRLDRNRVQAARGRRRRVGVEPRLEHHPPGVGDRVVGDQVVVALPRRRPAGCRTYTACCPVQTPSRIRPSGGGAIARQRSLAGSYAAAGVSATASPPGSPPTTSISVPVQRAVAPARGDSGLGAMPSRSVRQRDDGRLAVRRHGDGQRRTASNAAAAPTNGRTHDRRGRLRRKERHGGVRHRRHVAGSPHAAMSRSAARRPSSVLRSGIGHLRSDRLRPASDQRSNGGAPTADGPGDLLVREIGDVAEDDRRALLPGQSPTRHRGAPPAGPVGSEAARPGRDARPHRGDGGRRRRRAPPTVAGTRRGSRRGPNERADRRRHLARPPPLRGVSPGARRQPRPARGSPPRSAPPAPTAMSRPQPVPPHL